MEPLLAPSLWRCITDALSGALALVWLLPALPLFAALAISVRMAMGFRSVPMARSGDANDANDMPGDAAEPATASLARGSAIALLPLLVCFALAAAGSEARQTVVVGEWLAVEGVRVPLVFLCDATTLALAAAVAFIGWATLHFSIAYLHREPGFHRFFLGMCVFLGGMLLLVTAGDLVLAFVGWELCGIASWLLIGYADTRPVATGNALFAFLANRIGDAGFLLAVALAYWWMGTAEWSAVASGAIPETVKARLLAFGLVSAALAKSAQLPFTPWIARALEGPTASSAIFYGAVMVHAGVILLVRAAPLLMQVPDLMAGLALAGLATAIYAWLCGRVQTDVKSALVYATVTHVGLMVLACGLGFFTLAKVWLVLHALWRAWQFLMAPSYLLLAPKTLPLPRWLSGNAFLYTAALQRFWIDRAAHGLLTRPTLALGRDVREFDDRVLDRLLGKAAGRDGDALIQGRGLAGRALLRAADLLQRFEDRLVLQGGGGAMGRLLQRVGEALKIVEALLEQPRYLMLMVMATFVVIL